MAGLAGGRFQRDTHRSALDDVAFRFGFQCIPGDERVPEGPSIDLAGCAALDREIVAVIADIQARFRCSVGGFRRLIDRLTKSVLGQSSRRHRDEEGDLAYRQILFGLVLHVG
ncbi:hypothetical protein J2W51_003338 [Tardiphaga robiniae]|jgi:hypothetical protein|uniref:hypothetical protein n=1 Tax=Tardiphaga robiniae TaxID=943830 RepID=UPI00285BDD22|nr:hypothetical protein [Tardiphaga robiniae]MDR6660768.1 hypothetical protein [Tardiphaga robiniae]